MKVYKRGNTWWYRFQIGGAEIRESAHTDKKPAAEKLMRERFAAIKSGRQPAKFQVLTFAQLEKLVRDDYEINGRRTADQLNYRFDSLRRYFGNWTSAQITTHAIAEFQAERLKEGYKPASINRDLTILRSAFRIAAERELVAKRPIIHTLREDNARQGFVTKAQFYAIHAHLPEWMKDPTEWLFLSGMRSGTMKKLERRHYDAARSVLFVPDEIVKNGEGQEVPIAGHLAVIIERALADARPDCPWLFHWDGGQLTSHMTEYWNAACEAAGMRGILMHDLRRSAIRIMRDAGVDEQTAMSLSGHKTASVFRRYRILTIENKQQALEKIAAYLDEQPNEPKVVPLRGRK